MRLSFVSDFEPIHTQTVIFFIKIKEEISNNELVFKILKWIAHDLSHYLCKYDGSTPD